MGCLILEQGASGPRSSCYVKRHRLLKSTQNYIITHESSQESI